MSLDLQLLSTVKEVNNQEPRQWLNIYKGHLTLYISNDLCSRDLRLSRSPCVFQNPAPLIILLCVQTFTLHMGTVTLLTVCMFLIITLEINMHIQTICIKLVIFALKQKLALLDGFFEHLWAECFQQRTMASTAVVGHKLRLWIYKILNRSTVMKHTLSASTAMKPNPSYHIQIC